MQLHKKIKILHLYVIVEVATIISHNDRPYSRKRFGFQYVGMSYCLIADGHGYETRRKSGEVFMFVRLAQLLLPVFSIIFIGGFCRYRNYINRDLVKYGNEAIFKVFLPLSLFLSIYRLDNIGKISLLPLCFLMSYTVLIFILGWIYNTRLCRDVQTRSVMIQSYIRPNLLLFGLPIAASYYTDQGYELVILNLLLMVPFVNIMALLCFELGINGRVPLRTIAGNIMKNKIVTGAMAGLVCRLIGLEIPEWFLKPVQSLSSVAGPLGLFLIGAGLSFQSVRKEGLCVADSVLWKNFLVPYTAIFIAVLLGLRGQSLFVIAIALLSPVAISSYTYAIVYTNKDKLAAMLVMMTTLVSLGSVSLAFFVLMKYSLI